MITTAAPLKTKDTMVDVQNVSCVNRYSDIDVTARDATASRRAGWRHNHIQLTTSVGRALREQYPVIRDDDTVASIQNVSSKNGTANFSGRDLAVAFGLCAIGLAHAEWPGRYMGIGGQVFDLEEGRFV